MTTGEGRHTESVPIRDGAEQASANARDCQSVTTPDALIPARVWLTARQTGEFEADGRAVAWTPRQVRARYDDPHGRTGYAWVWSSAVTRR
ncbi:hypothetical protein EV386_0015 [Xylanimonas ulmi]|uniref:Uncharacterized protein n=1 Tax=Xylanimonas ulmi TaxID=228973 RepID=A0A4Q7LZ37_9MICO|nr:hypothetical protein EV386_0015 [Xylanibacterium ulmi]